MIQTNHKKKVNLPKTSTVILKKKSKNKNLKTLKKLIVAKLILKRKKGLKKHNFRTKKFLKIKVVRSMKVKNVLTMLRKLQVRFQIKKLFLKNNFKKNLKRIFKYWVWEQKNSKLSNTSKKRLFCKSFLKKKKSKFKYLNFLINLKFDFRKIYGVILSIKDGVAKVVGLKGVKSGEMVYLGLTNYSLQAPNGMVLSLNKGFISVACFDGGVSALKCGDRVFRTFRLISIPFSLKLFGRTLDPLGVPLDGKDFIKSNIFLEIDTKAVGIIPRESVKEPMQTGVLAVDSLTPIGCGQRELIIGDRQTGKTSLALDAISTQLFYNGRCYCIYVGVGQKKASVAKINDFFFGGKSIYYTKALKRLLIISSSSSDSAVLQFLAPYTGCSVGEWLSKKGGHALVIYDDLSKQAIAYRQMSLLLRRPPGREAYPGDVFYLHSRLLERSAKFAQKRGGGSLTSLPIIETQAGDVSAYIPTNVISRAFFSLIIN